MNFILGMWLATIPQFFRHNTPTDKYTPTYKDTLARWKREDAIAGRKYERMFWEQVHKLGDERMKEMSQIVKILTEEAD